MPVFNYSCPAALYNKMCAKADELCIKRSKLIQIALEQYITYGDWTNANAGKRQVIRELMDALDERDNIKASAEESQKQAEALQGAAEMKLKRYQQLIASGGKLPAKPEKALPFDQALKEILTPHNEQMLARSEEGNAAVIASDFVDPSYKYDDPAYMTDDNGVAFAYKHFPDVDALAALGLKVETREDDIIRYFILSPIDAEK